MSTLNPSSIPEVPQARYWLDGKGEDGAPSESWEGICK